MEIFKVPECSEYLKKILLITHTEHYYDFPEWEKLYTCIFCNCKEMDRWTRCILFYHKKSMGPEERAKRDPNNLSYLQFV